jgi:hypothetical protein
MRKRFVNASPEYTGSWSTVNFGENQSVNSSPENTSSWLIEEFYEEGTCESNPSLVARDHGLMVARGDSKGNMRSNPSLVAKDHELHGRPKSSKGNANPVVTGRQRSQAHGRPRVPRRDEFRKQFMVRRQRSQA